MSKVVFPQCWNRKGPNKLTLMSSSNFIFMLPMEMFNVPPVITLAEGNCSQMHEYGTISTLSGKSPKCSTDIATTLPASGPSVMSSMAFLSDSRFLTNCLSLPRWMRSSIASFRWMQSSVTCSWHLWNRQYFVLSTPLK